MTVPRRSLIAGTLAVLALVLVLVAAVVTSGALDWFEIAIALVLLVASYLLQHDARRQSLYARPPDDEQPSRVVERDGSAGPWS